MRRFLYPSLALTSLLSFACSGPTAPSNATACQASVDTDCDGVPDALGQAVVDAQGNWGQHDFDGDGKGDGWAVDVNNDGVSDGIILDTTGDGFGDSVDLNGDYQADDPSPPSGSGGATDPGGTTTGGTTGTGGTASGATASGGSTTGGCNLGEGHQSGAGTTTNAFEKANVKRDSKNYKMITNAWGDNWQSHKIAWKGTSLTIEQFAGTKTPNGAPAAYPAVFCGQYSDDMSTPCGLPAPLGSLTSLNTGLSWSHAANDGTYNVTYDVWMGNGGSLSSYFMVWFKNPTGENPAGSKTADWVEVANVPGSWNIIAGSVNGRPIVNYVRPDGQESKSLTFDMMDFLNDAKDRGLNFPGKDVLSVAVGFEIWQGPVTNLKLEDFCIDVK